MKNLLIVLFALCVSSTTMYVADNFTLNKVYSQTDTTRQFNNGPLSGISQNTNGKVDWVISGNWKTSLSSNTDNQNSKSFDATIDMIRPDGTGRHTHTLNFTVTDESYPSSNMIMYNGVSTVTMKEGSLSNIPTTLVLSNKNIISIMLDPSSVQHHFGESPFYGIIVNNNGQSNGTTTGLQNGQLGGQLQGSINGLTNGIIHGTMNGIMNGMHNGPIGGLLQGLIH